MNELLSARRVSSFEPILAAYKKAGIELRSSIDGGAGAGQTATRIIGHTSGAVYAFEPFPGNHRFFSDLDPRIKLIPKALYHENARLPFRVSSVVSAESEWGRRGMTGYSSLGYLVEERKDDDLQVECVRADKLIKEPIDFVKLDLQGGELGALNGMSGFLRNVAFMWVEYTGQERLVEFITGQGFLLFDTEYFFWGRPSEAAKALFDVSKDAVQLSTGASTWTGFKKTRWRHFERQFPKYREELRLGWTDLVCVNKTRLPEFLQALRFI